MPRKRGSKSLPKGVYRRPDAAGYWVSFMREGRRVRRFGGYSLEDAERVLTGLKAQFYELGTLPAPRRDAGLRLGVFEARFLEPRARGDNAPAGSLAELWFRSKVGSKDPTIRQRWGLIADYFQPSCPVRALTSEAVDGFKAWLLQPLEKDEEAGPHRRRKQMTKSTANRVLAQLRAALNLASRRRVPHPDPFREVQLFREPKQPRRGWTEREFKAFVEAFADDHAMVLAVQLAWATGLRAGNLGQMQWKWVDLEDRIIHVPSSSTKNETGLTVPLTEEATKALEAHRAHEWAEPDAPVLGLSGSEISKRFSLKKKELGFGAEVTFHSARHAVRSRLSDAGADLAAAKAILGHGTTEASLRYTHVSADRLREVMEKANRG